MKKVLPVIALFCFYACERPPVDPVILGAEGHLVGKLETLTHYLEGEKLDTQTKWSNANYSRCHYCWFKY